MYAFSYLGVPPIPNAPGLSGKGSGYPLYLFPEKNWEKDAVPIPHAITLGFSVLVNHSSFLRQWFVGQKT